MKHSPRHYQHPLDRESLLNLRAIKWFEGISKYVVADDLERDFHLLNLVDNVLMTRRDFPNVIEHLEHACQRLGLTVVPRLFLDTNPAPHTLCVGEQNPMIVLSTGMLELLAEEELAAALAHEVGHIACQHAYYKLLAENFGGISQLSGVVPGLGVAAFTLKLPLFDWYRKADLTADRAALLVMRDIDPVVKMIGKIAGGSGRLAQQISLESLLEQARETRSAIDGLQAGNLKQRVTYFFSNLVMQGMLRTQPWPAIRVLEIQQWAASTSCQLLLQGQEPPEEQGPPERSSPKTTGFFKTWTDLVSDAGRSLFWSSGESPGDKPIPPPEEETAG
jgi:Zn-dependent protease with chaperone function